MCVHITEKTKTEELNLLSSLVIVDHKIEVQMCSIKIEFHLFDTKKTL